MLKNVTIFSLLILLALVLLHRVIFGTRCASKTGEKKSRSYGAFERLVHAGLAVGFLVLAATGFVSVLCYKGLEDELLQLHMFGAGLFAVCLALTTLLWAADARFVLGDWAWLKACGGFLRRGGAILPAADGERFDAGQKLFFWIESTLGLACMATALVTMFPIFSSEAIGMCILVHAYCALALVLVVVLHIYVGLVVKPKAWKRTCWGVRALRIRVPTL